MDIFPCSSYWTSVPELLLVTLCLKPSLSHLPSLLVPLSLLGLSSSWRWPAGVDHGSVFRPPLCSRSMPPRMNSFTPWLQFPPLYWADGIQISLSCPLSSWSVYATAHCPASQASQFNSSQKELPILPNHSAAALPAGFPSAWPGPSIYPGHKPEKESLLTTPAHSHSTSNSSARIFS